MAKKREREREKSCCVLETFCPQIELRVIKRNPFHDLCSYWLTDCYFLASRAKKNGADAIKINIVFFFLLFPKCFSQKRSFDLLWFVITKWWSWNAGSWFILLTGVLNFDCVCIISALMSRWGVMASTFEQQINSLFKTRRGFLFLPIGFRESAWIGKKGFEKKNVVFVPSCYTAFDDNNLCKFVD